MSPDNKTYTPKQFSNIFFPKLHEQFDVNAKIWCLRQKIIKLIDFDGYTSNQFRISRQRKKIEKKG